MRPGFKSRKRHLFLFFFFFLFIFCVFFLSLLLQCKFANSTLLSLLSFSYFITPYDAQASSAFSALIYSVGPSIFHHLFFMKVVEILIFCPYEFYLSLKKVHHFSLTSKTQKGRRFTVPIIMLNIRKTKSPCVQT